MAWHGLAWHGMAWLGMAWHLEGGAVEGEDGLDYDQLEGHHDACG